MTETITQYTAPNLFVEARGVRYAYRRYGNAGSGALPLLFLQHFRGNLDNWDPSLVDAIAAEREIILFDNAGVGGSSGATPDTVTGLAHDTLAFVDALGLTHLDLLGFSLGGYTAQELVQIRPALVRRLVLAGTGPRGGEGMHGFSGAVHDAATKDVQGAEDLLFLFFTKSAASVGKGWELVQRIYTRAEDRDEPVSLDARDAQLNALTDWGVPDDTQLGRLASITQSTLVANGEDDIMVPIKNSHLLAERLPNATLKLYSDAGHGFLFQYPVEFAAEVNAFLK